MPITLPPISRRQFLGRSVAAGAALWLGGRLAAAESKVDADRFALFSDTHIDADPAKINRMTNMTDNLRAVCKDVLSLSPRPAAVIVNGDLAHSTGEAGDYAQFLSLVAPLREAGLPIHLTLGNHDHREHFWSAIPAAEPKPLADRHVTVIESPKANVFLLDSLSTTNKTPGLCGEAQFKWLASALDARADKPAITFVHHDPNKLPTGTGLVDTPALMAILKPRKHVKLHLFGHTHNWELTDDDGLHLVNLPPTAYLFKPGRPNGWVDLHLANDGATLQLHALDATHPENGKPIELKWR